MSTKTTFKRIALVAVAAMGFGLLSVVPSSAAHTYQADVLSVSAATSAITMGSTASVTVTQAFIAATTQTSTDSITVTASFTAAPVGTVAADLGNFVFSAGSNTSNNVGTRTFSVDPIAVSAYTSASYTITLTPTVAGTYVVKFNPTGADSDTQALNATAQTWTVTVAAAAAAGAPDSTSTALMAKGRTSISAGSADQTVLVPMAVGSAVAVIDVTPLVGGLATTGSTSVTAVLTGPGTLGMSGTDGTAAASVGKSFTYTHTAAGHVYVYVWADGTSGTASIAVSLGSVLVGTKTVKFYGAAASVTTTQMDTVVDSGSGAASTGVLVATVKDAAGNVVPSAALFVISSSSAVFASGTATTGSAGTATISVLGLAAGTATLTVQSYAAGSAAGTTGFSAPAVSVRAGDDLASSVALTLDKATYAAGEAAVLTVTVKDAAGNLVASGTQSIFTAAGATSTRATGGVSLPGASFVSAGSTYGVMTYKINAPTTQGAFTISATLGGDLLSAGSAVSVSATVDPSAAETAAVAAAVANAAAAAATAKTNADAAAATAAANAAAAAAAAKANADAAAVIAAANAAAAAAAIVAAADIASAAVDAAAEATDAANAATDAANAAAEAADAATAAAQDAADAVASLATAVAELMADLKAQIAAQKAAITALTNLVIKIQKKLKA